MLADAFQRLTQIRFTDAVATGSVNIVDAVLNQLLHQQSGAGCVDALNGDTTEAHGRNLQTCFAQYAVFHNEIPPFSFLMILYKSGPIRYLNLKLLKNLAIGSITSDKSLIASFSESKSMSLILAIACSTPT